MARAELPPSLQEIRNPTSVQAHVTALKELKHEIIGHEQRKELVVHHGILGLLVRNMQDEEGPHSEELNEVRIQSIQIIGSLAHGGLAFMHPLLAAGVLRPLLTHLSHATYSARVVVETLRATYAIAEALATDIMSPVETSPMVRVCWDLYGTKTVENLKDILAQRETGPSVDEQITLTMKIFRLTLWTPALGEALSRQYSAMLVKTGVLDLLASRLASLVAKLGQQVSKHIEPAVEAAMLPSPPESSLRHLLEALSCIIRYSAYRSLRLLYSTNMLAVFPMASPPTLQTSPDDLSFAEQTALPTITVNPLDTLLPRLQAVQSKNEHSFSKAFPALQSFVMPSGYSRMPTFSDGQTTISSRLISSADEFGSPLIAWLLLVARNSLDLKRLAALDLLTHLYSALDHKVLDSWAESPRNRDRTLAFLVVPLLVRIIESSNAISRANQLDSVPLTGSDILRNQRIKEYAPEILGILVNDCPALQKAAVDAHAIKLLCQMLKKSFDPVSTIRKVMWSPVGYQAAPDYEYDKTCNLGPASVAPEAVHVLKCRASALKALSAIAQKEDSYRKVVIEQGIMTCLVDSLVPYPDPQVDAMETEKEKEGNPNFVAVEACILATALSRSVSNLRTSLIDGGIAKPIFELMKSVNAEVRAAATDTVTNLLLRFSPMRDELLGLGIVKLLCQLAHSSDAKQRISALWALKHITDSAPPEIKKSIIEGLGAGWLIQVMSGESYQHSVHRSQLATPNAAGERVDILNDEEPAMDVDDVSDDAFSDSHDSVVDMRVPSVPARYKARLLAIKYEEESPKVRAEKDDVRIQEQALDIVRNAISEAAPSQPEMIDFLLTTLGSARLFECLENKLRPSRSQPTYPTANTTSHNMPAGKRPTLTTPGGSGLSMPSNRNTIDQFPLHLYSHATLLENVMFILVHIANGTVSHKHLLLNLGLTLPPPGFFSSPQPPNVHSRFLDLLVPLFSHPNRKIRVVCCWFVHNILWQEDKSDEVDTRMRALEMKKRGFEEAIKRCTGDVDLDVRERARSCVDIWGRLLGEAEDRRGNRVWSESR
ncbi:hypothetical protein FKW77_005097 [Venturia effusa]|uniref:Uncharacterized protein n=1 Tax=Venturia effusa TaxID=50376 RepID=A0A517LMR2_9PEZI|nr:hypothetical protein FKW77_005097 [Venturia effusa]